jgi:predicted transcriptional regulator
MADDNSDELLSLTTEIVAAHVAHNRVGVSELADLIGKVHAALAGLGGNEQEPAAPPEQKPAVSIRASVKPDYIVCLEDGKKLTMLKRYLQTNFGMTPQEYRTKWRLPADYPMVAPNYAERRRTLAKAIGLGRKSGADAPASRRGRKRTS